MAGAPVPTYHPDASRICPFQANTVMTGASERVLLLSGGCAARRASLMRLPHPRPGRGQPGCALLQAGLWLRPWPWQHLLGGPADKCDSGSASGRLAALPHRLPAGAPRVQVLPALPTQHRLRWPRVRGRLADQRDLYLACFPSNRFCWGWSGGSEVDFEEEKPGAGGRE